MPLKLFNTLVFRLSLLFLLFITFSGYSQDFYILEKPKIQGDNYSGDKQHQKIGKQLSKIIRFRVTKNDTIPIKGYDVDVDILSMPSGAKGFVIHDKKLKTDDNGIARTYITLGDKEGEYSVIASITSRSSKRTLVYSFYAKSSKWLLYLFAGLFGGLGLFLFGMDMMGNGLQKAAGDKMRNILSRITKNKTFAFGAGAIFTMIIQSSTAMAVMLMSFVNSRLMPYKSTIPILIGAAIGTTITAQLIAFKVTDFAIVFVGIGASIYLFSKNTSSKNIGESILGFGLLFFGLKIMSESMFPLRSWDPFLNLLLSFENPILGIGVGALFTALIHSSSACIGIIMVFACQGLISLESGMYLLLGANLGTSATALIAGINTTLEARKVAYTELIYKTVMVLLFVGFVPLMVKLFNYYSYKNIPLVTNEMISDTLPRQIANAHTIINVVLALIILPIIPLFEKIMNYLFPEQTIKPLYTIKYLDKNILSSPVLALNLAKQETLRLGRKIYILTDEIIIAFTNNDTHALQDIFSKREEVKSIRDEIKSYLIEISKNVDEKRLKEIFQMIHVVQELSHINDAITKILLRRAEKWIDRHYEFSQESKDEILDIHNNTLKIFKRSLDIFESFNLEKAKELKKKQKEFREMVDSIEHSHYERLIKGNTIDSQSSKTQLEIIYSLNTISQNALNIAHYFVSKMEDYNEIDKMI